MRRQAEELVERALAAQELEKRVALLREAAQLVPYNGSVHNNLGVALLEQEAYYEAAQHLDQAVRLLPADPAPRLNLGLLFEQVDQLEKAQRHYEDALIVGPEYPEALQALARVRVRRQQLDQRTRELLEAITLRATDPQWREWARRQLSQAYFIGPSQPSAGPTPAPPELAPR